MLINDNPVNKALEVIFAIKAIEHDPNANLQTTTTDILEICQALVIANALLKPEDTVIH